MHPGPMKFKAASSGQTVTLEVNDTTPSKIVEAITRAAALLSTTTGDIIVGDLHRTFSTMSRNSLFRGKESISV